MSIVNFFFWVCVRARAAKCSATVGSRTRGSSSPSRALSPGAAHGSAGVRCPRVEEDLVALSPVPAELTVYPTDRRSTPMFAARLARQLNVARPLRAVRRVSTTPARRSDALFVVSTAYPRLPCPCLTMPLTATPCSTGTPPTTTPRCVLRSTYLLLAKLASDPVRVHSREPQACPGDHLPLPSSVQEGCRHSPP